MSKSNGLEGAVDPEAAIGEVAEVHNGSRKRRERVAVQTQLLQGRELPDGLRDGRDLVAAQEQHLQSRELEKAFRFSPFPGRATCISSRNKHCTQSTLPPFTPSSSPSSSLPCTLEAAYGPRHAELRSGALLPTMDEMRATGKGRDDHA